MQEELKWIYSVILQKQLKISELCALVKKEHPKYLEKICISKIQYSIESFQDLWLKQETLQTLMELEENLFMGLSLQMKTLFIDTLVLEFYQWLMLDQEQTAHNFLFALINFLIWIKNMLSLGKSQKDSKHWEQLKSMEAEAELHLNR